MSINAPDVTALRGVLSALGYDTDPECGDTPARLLRTLQDFAPGQPIPALDTFAAPSAGDEVQLFALPFYSLCAHHLLPFFGSVDVVYVAGERIAGLGAVARTVRHFARQPQLQERLGAQLAEHLHAALGAPVAVRIRARQLCMEMRGVESTGEVVTVSRRGGASAVLFR
ncbi:MAG: GTP cyclohydrolase I FolE [Myxococcales bacterium]|nr:GTP cyclohydrolase I FolE [Myxococcales bacterium]